MRRALALGIFALGAASAHAQGKGPMAKPAWVVASPPKGWNELPGLARSVSTTLEQSRSFGDVRGRAGAQAFAQPGTGAFYVSWLVADKPAPERVQALRSALDAVRHSRIAGSPDARSTEELKYTESVTENLAEAVLEWRHVSNETLSLVRAFAWLSPAGAPRLLKGECVVSTTDGKPPPAVETACREALAALVAKVPAGERASLADLPAGAAAPPPADDLVVPDSPEAAGSPTARPPDTVGPAPPGDQKILYAGPPPEPTGDSMSKWFVVLGGALLVLGLFLTYRARARSAAAAGAAAAPAPAPAPAPADPDPDPDPDPGPDSDPDPGPDSDPDPEGTDSEPAAAETKDDDEKKP